MQLRVVEVYLRACNVRPDRVGALLAVTLYTLTFFIGWPMSGRHASAAVISFQGSTTESQASGTGSITIDKPSATVRNDVMIALIGVEGVDTTVTPPTGWNAFTNSTTLYTNAGTHYVEIFTLWKAATNSEPSDYTFTIGSNGNYAGGIATYQGVDIITPIDVAGGNNTNTPNSDTSPVATTITPTIDNTMLITVFGAHNTAVRTYTAPSGMTERVDVGSNNILSSDASIGLFDQQLTTASATGSRTGTLNGTGRWAAHQFTLKPAAPNMMILWDGGAAPTGWTIVTAFDGKFLRGNALASYADTGGGGTHTPTVANTTVGANDGTTPKASSSGSTGAPTGHTHTLNGSMAVGAASNNDEPAYRTLKLIRFNTGIPDIIPAGGIVMFDDNPGMPGSGWTRQSAQDGKMIKIDSSVGTGGSDTHNHTLTWPALNAASGSVATISLGNTQADAGHTHTAPSSTTTSTNGTDTCASSGCLPPHIAPILAKADSDVVVPTGMFAMFDDDPGTQWDMRSDSGDTFYQQFLRPASTFNGTSAGAASHTHANATATTGTATSSTGNFVTGPQVADAHNHVLTTTFNSVESMPEYFDVPIAEKNASFVNMILFWDGGTAPTGWTIITGSDGKFPRGEAPENYAATGGTTTHTPTTSSVTAGQATGANSSGNDNAANHSATYTHTHTASITSIASANNLPAHRTLKMIRYNGGVPNIIPEGAIAIFDGDPGIPNSGWTRQTNFDDRFVRNDSTTANTNGGSDTHTHNLDWAALGGAVGEQRRVPFIFNISTSTVGHTHNAATDTNTGTNATDPCDAAPVDGQCLPQHVQVFLAKADADTPTLSVGLTAMFDAAPGGGWVVRSSSGGPYYQRFLRGGNGYVEGLGAATHTHSNATVQSPVNNGGSPGNSEDLVGSGTLAENNHTHTITAAFNAVDHTPEYFNVVIAEKVNFILHGYRWYEDPSPESENVSATNEWSTLNLPEGDPIPTLPAAYSPPDIKTELRLRVRLLVNNNNLSIGEMQFKLQYKAGTDGSCTTGTWFDMGAGGSGDVWRYATSTVTDGEELDTSVLGSDILQKYVKSDSAGTNPNAVATGETMEYDFHIEHNGAAGATKYSFRLIEDTGILLSQYTECPTLSTKPAAADLLRHGNFFESGVEQGFIWAD